MPEGRGWRRYVFWAFASLSAFVMAYVVYVHVHAASRRMSPDVRDFTLTLGATGKLPEGYQTRVQGALVPAFEGGQLAMHGAAQAGDSFVVSSAPRRFDDGVLTLRFRVPDAGIETFLGLEQPDTGRTLAASFVPGKEPFVMVGGDLSGPMRAVTGDVRAPVTAAAGEWHTLALQFTPAFAMVSMAFDGRPVASLPVQWFQGTNAKIVFGIHAREATPNVTAEFDSLALQTLDWTIPASFDDRFAGALIDNKRWLFNEPDPAMATLTAKTEKGRGLVLASTVHGFVSDPAFAYMMRTFPFALRSFHLHAELSVDELVNSTLFIGLMGASEWIPQGRVFDTGIVKRGDGASFFVAGSWTNDAKLTFDLGHGTTVPCNLIVELDYDAKTLMGRIQVNQEPAVERPLDLKPLDLVAFRIGSLGHAADAKTTVRIQRITLDVR